MSQHFGTNCTCGVKASQQAVLRSTCVNTQRQFWRISFTVSRYKALNNLHEALLRHATSLYGTDCRRRTEGLLPWYSVRRNPCNEFVKYIYSRNETFPRNLLSCNSTQTFLGSIALSGVLSVISFTSRTTSTTESASTTIYTLVRLLPWYMLVLVLIHMTAARTITILCSRVCCISLQCTAKLSSKTAKADLLACWLIRNIIHWTRLYMISLGALPTPAASTVAAASGATGLATPALRLLCLLLLTATISCSHAPSLRRPRNGEHPWSAAWPLCITQLRGIHGGQGKNCVSTPAGGNSIVSSWAVVLSWGA